VGCPEGKYECDGGCVDYLSDPLHCGSCPGKCPTREGALAICIEANCYLSCEDQAHIPADVDFDNDVENCGRCGNKCPTKPGGTAECYLGECVEPCEAVGLTDCGGICVDTRENRSHCGECDEVCAAEAECEYGRCDCGSWMQHCDGECVDDDSVDHCGECNKVCPEVPNASRRCWSRECDHSCNSDYVKCGEDEACLGAGGAECSNDDDCCGAKGYVCYLGQCTAYPGCPNYTQDCPDPERYECAFDVCLKKCSSDSDCPDDSGRSGRCYERQWSSAHGFYVGTDACYLSCGQDSDCPYSGMRCSNTNWAESGKMCIWD